MKISVIVPCYNEEKNVINCYKRVKKILKGYNYEIILEEEGSKDRTPEIIKALARKDRKVRVLSFPGEKRGKGWGFRKCVQAAKGDIVVQVDTDCQFVPEEIPKLIKPILYDDYDMTLGSRFMKDSCVKKGSITTRNYIANKIDSLLTSIASFRWFTDVQAGFKAFRKNVIKNIKFKENSFAYEPEIVILASKRGYKIKDVPITYERRLGGRSNIKLFKDGYMITKAILRTWIFG